jgi:hypothetical protein
MGRKKGRRTRSNGGSRTRYVTRGSPGNGNGPFEHNQWTVEGRIERLGHLAGRLRSDSVPLPVKLVFLVPLLVTLVLVLISVIVN